VVASAAPTPWCFASRGAKSGRQRPRRVASPAKASPATRGRQGPSRRFKEKGRRKRSPTTTRFEDGDQIVKTAIDTWGKIDIVINNARHPPRCLVREDEARPIGTLVYKVHVLGTFKVTHAAWPYMRDLPATAASSTRRRRPAIYGNFGPGQLLDGQARHPRLHARRSPAEGKKRKHRSSTRFAPIAGSRMTETVLPKRITRGAIKARVRVGARRGRLAPRSHRGHRRPVRGRRRVSTRSWRLGERAAGKTFSASVAPSRPDDVQRELEADHELRQVGASRRAVAESMQPIMGERRGRPEQGRQFSSSMSMPRSDTSIPSKHRNTTSAILSRCTHSASVCPRAIRATRATPRAWSTR